MIESYLIVKYGEYLDNLDIYENNKSLKLALIVIKKEYRGTGIGSKIMTDLTNYADKNKQIIVATPSNDFGGNKNKVIQFNKKFGFKHNQGQYKSYEYMDTMIRYPKLNETMKPVIKQLLREQLLLEKDNREIIVNKMGLSKQIADYAHAISDKYSIWIARELDRENNKYLSNSINTSGKLIGDYYYKKILKIVGLFKTQNKPKTDINNLNFATANGLLDTYDYIMDWVNNPNTPSINLTNMTWEEAELKATEWHDSLKAGGKVSNILGDNSEIIHKFSDGYYWALTKSNYCDKSQESMGHCAEATWKDMYLLRLIKNDEEFVTADWHPTDKYIIQLKGKQNQKPNPKYYPHILWLIGESGMVYDLRTNQGYRPETNFQLSDLSENDITFLITRNEKLIPDILSTYKDKKLIIKKIFELAPNSINEKVIEEMLSSIQYMSYKDTVANMIISLKGETLNIREIYSILLYSDKKIKIANSIINAKNDMLTKSEQTVVDEFTSSYSKKQWENTTNIKQLLRERLLTKEETDVRDVSDFVNFAKEFLGINDDIKVALVYKRTPDIKTTALYSLDGFIKIYVKDRAIIDICRSIAHELVHHKQNLDGRLVDAVKDGEDGSDIENEANALAGVMIRKWGKLHPEIYE